MELNVKTEVSKEAFGFLKVNADGIVAHRQEGDKYFVKLMIPKYLDYVDRVLLKFPVPLRSCLNP